MVANQVVRDPHVPQAQARQFGDVAVVLGVESGPHDVDEFYLPLLLGSALEEFFIAGADGAVGELLVDDHQTLLNLLGVGRSAVSAEEKLHHVAGHRIVPRVSADEVLADEVAVEGARGHLIESVEYECHVLAPTVVLNESRMVPLASITTTTAGFDSRLSSATTIAASSFLES